MANEAVVSSFSPRAIAVGIKDFFGDKRFVAGTVMGLALLAGGYAVSASSGGGSGGSSSDPISQLLSDQESVITTQMRQDAEDCAKGDKEGTVGNAINMSLKAHLELASASPNVEQLFDVNADCFSGLSSLIDLSFAIPSLATILAAAQDAVMQYAKKKICSAVGKVTGMVTGPINQAIGNANQYIGALNGLSANLNNGGGLSMLDPNLGAAYNPGTSGTYVTGQPFGNRPQAGFDNPPTGGSTGTPAAPAPGSVGAGNGTPAPSTPLPTTPGGYGRPQEAAALLQALAQRRTDLVQAEADLTAAQSNYDSCVNSASDPANQCRAENTALAVARNRVSQIKGDISNIEGQLEQMRRLDGLNPQSATVPSPAKEQTLTQKLSNLFK